jgi:hypothetical protein
MVSTARSHLRALTVLAPFLFVPEVRVDKILIMYLNHWHHQTSFVLLLEMCVVPFFPIEPQLPPMNGA